MIDAVGYQYLPKYYGLAEQSGQTVQSAGIAQPVFGQNETSGTEQAQKVDGGSDKFQTPYERAVQITGELRKESNQNLAALSKVKSEKLDELLTLHSQISDECWAKLEAYLRNNSVDTNELDGIVKDMEARYAKLIALEKAALGETANSQETPKGDSTEPRTIAIA